MSGKTCKMSYEHYFSKYLHFASYFTMNCFLCRFCSKIERWNSWFWAVCDFLGQNVRSCLSWSWVCCSHLRSNLLLLCHFFSHKDQWSTCTLSQLMSGQSLRSTKHYAHHSPSLAHNFGPTAPAHRYFQIGKQPTRTWWRMEERIYTILVILMSSSLYNIPMSRLLSKAT